MGLISRAEKEYIRQGIEAGIRNDGRKPLQFRELVLETGLLAQTSGSAQCQLGDTRVLVGVKADVGTPLPETPDFGGLEVAVDCSPCALQGTASEGLGFELARVLQRSLKWEQSGPGCAIDLTALKIVSGKRCWVLFVDGLVLSADGNLLSALSIAVKAALMDLRIPHLEVSMGEEGDDPELDLDDNPELAASLDTSRVPVIVTVSQGGTANVLDLTEEEEAACGSSGLHVAVNAKGSVYSVSKAGSTAVQPGRLVDMVAAAQKVGPQLHRAIDSYVPWRSGVGDVPG